MDDKIERGGQDQESQVLEPVEQESILFHNQTIVAVRLGDGRICVVLRWVCESMNLQPGGQVRKIERTSATAKELVRVKVQTRGGRQSMPAITLRGFSPWVLSINSGEVKADSPAEEERIRTLIIAYQEEAKDVLYEHFVSRRPALPAPSTAVFAEPSAPPPGATHAELATYHAAMSLWHRWKADLHAEEWRGEIDVWRDSVETRLEGNHELLQLIPEIIERIGPECINTQQQRQVQAYVRQLSEATGKHPATIYDDLKTAFACPRYQELKADEWPQVVNWFQMQLERARHRGGRS